MEVRGKGISLNRSVPSTAQLLPLPLLHAVIPSPLPLFTPGLFLPLPPSLPALRYGKVKESPISPTYAPFSHQVWDLRTRKLKVDLPGHADEVFTVDWAPDGSGVASGGKDRVLKLWRH